MPNHVSNIIKMKGIAKEDLFTVDENGTKYFDFNKLIPMPEELNIESGSHERDCIEAVLRLAERKGAFLTYHTMPDELWEKVAQEHDVTELAKQGLVYLTNVIKYGATTWYDWSREHWGTKWNSYELEILDDDTIRFQTAWSDPTPVIEKLSKLYPDRRISCWYADEFSCFTGCYVMENGERLREEFYQSEGERSCDIYNISWAWPDGFSEDSLDDLV